MYLMYLIYPKPLFKRLPGILEQHSTYHHVSGGKIRDDTYWFAFGSKKPRKIKVLTHQIHEIHGFRCVYLFQRKQKMSSCQTGLYLL